MTKPRSVASTANDNSIPGSRIENGSVTVDKLNITAGAISGSAIEDGTVTTEKLEDGTVTQDKISQDVSFPPAPDSVSNETVSSDAAIDSSKLEFDFGMTAIARSVSSKLRDTVSVKDFGAAGDGVTDDTTAIQKAINYAESIGGGRVVFPPGVYAGIPVQSGLSGLYNVAELKSGVYLDLTGSTLKLLPVDQTYRNGILIRNRTNCGVIGGKIIGDRNNSLKETEFSYGVSIVNFGPESTNNVLIQGVKIEDFEGDGIFVGPQTKTVFISDCLIKNSARNNISIVTGGNVLIDNCEIVGANGKPPEAGIDIEPNPGDTPGLSDNIIIRGCNIYDNNGSGVIFSGSSTTPLVEKAIVSNCHIYDNAKNLANIFTRGGLSLAFVRDLIVDNCFIYDNGLIGISDDDIYLEKCTISNCVIYNQTSGMRLFGGSASEFAISNNVLKNISETGISLSFCRNTVITNNILRDIGLSGIRANTSYINLDESNIIISNNAIENTGREGVILSSSDATRPIKKAIITGNSIFRPSSSSANSYSGIFLGANVSGTIVSNNVVARGNTLPKHAIECLDSDVSILNNNTSSGAGIGNEEISVPSVTFLVDSTSPSLIGDVYANRLVSRRFVSEEITVSVQTGTPTTILDLAGNSINSRSFGWVFVRDSGNSNIGSSAQFQKFTDGSSPFISLFNVENSPAFSSALSLVGTEIQFSHNVGSTKTVKVSVIYLVNDSN